MRNEDLEQAAVYWREGQPLEAGKLIFGNLPNSIRPKWASGILRLVLGRSEIHLAPIERVLYLADTPEEWRNGHRTFSAVRELTLELDDIIRDHGGTKEQESLSNVLALAELVAKVTYNATDPPDEFDEDSGWWIAACLRGFVDHRWRDEEFSKAAWSALCFEGCPSQE